MFPAPLHPDRPSLPVSARQMAVHAGMTAACRAYRAKRGRRSRLRPWSDFFYPLLYCAFVSCEYTLSNVSLSRALSTAVKVCCSSSASHCS